MQKLYKNICYRCGKERIITKTWKEKVWDSVIENTESVCPDKKCQATIEKDIRKIKYKRLQIEKRKRDSARDRKIAIHKKITKR